MNDYPIANLTDKEQIVLTEITRQCMVDYSADIKDTAKATGLTVETVRGVVGSLVKKGHIATEQGENFRAEIDDVFAVFGGEWLCYGDESGCLSESDFQIAEDVAKWN